MLHNVNPIGIVVLVSFIGLIGYFLYRIVSFFKPKNDS
ncbi:hypothetical protein JOE21_001128 [Desmospora profundinema]|uniref:Uncharacterized protein n=1 Tax=Desmospora profundinema TaxID=1571184 RepID=A0ABU1IK28_9BACL|nr:hypothetical protein [Desmospora profundinema]